MKKLNLTKEKKVLIIVNVLMFIAFVGIMALTAIKKGYYDLALSKKIGSQNNPFGVLFAQVGELPTYFIIPLASATILFSIKHDDKIKNILIKAPFLFLILIGYFVYFYKQNLTKLIVEKNIITKTNFRIYAVFMALLFTCFTIIVFYNLKRQTIYKLAKIAIFALCVALISLVVSRIFKYSFTRIRYRSFAPTNEFEKFVPWYKPGGIKVERIKDDWNFMSFPSGHTTSAANLFVIVPVFALFDKLKKYKKLAYALCWVFTIVVAISRVVAEAHFLSDVTFAIFISYTTYAICHHFFFKNGNYEMGSKYTEQQNI